MNETTLNGQSADIVSENIQRLKQIFPEVFCEDSVDFEKLQAVLGEYADDNEERYNFTWWGKSRALRLAQSPSVGTLRPCKEESKDWDTTENLYIEGDNLEVLKLLQKSYHGKVKMIYIDPPYNTGKDFVYPDDYKDPLQHYLAMTGQVDEEGKRVSTNSEASGRYHTNWLNMMYPRLRLARNLLRDDGVIFISIDDNEMENLKKICNELFGEDNFITSFMWKRKKEISSDSKNVAIQGEYILTYGKTSSAIFASEPLSEEYIKKSYKDPNSQFPLGKWRPVPLTVSKGLSGGGYQYKIATPTGKVHDRLWAYPQHSFQRLVEEKRVYYGIDGNGVPQRVIYSFESSGQPVTNYWENIATNKAGKKEILDLFSDNLFDTPKPSSLIIKMLRLTTANDDIVLDFFSGGGTTSHAVMKLNSKDGCKRKFIMVQLPEPTDENTEARKAGYENICEIGKERIRRAGEKIKAELQKKRKKQPSILGENASVHPDDLDVGFKVFKLDSSNLKKWNPDTENIEESLLDVIENYVDGRSELDVVYEIMLKYGIDLTLPLEEYEIGGKKIYSIGYGALMICLDREITTDVANEIVRLKEDLKPEVMRVVFKDNGFKDDSVKTNTKEILRNAGIDEIVSV